MIFDNSFSLPLPRNNFFFFNPGFNIFRFACCCWDCKLKTTAVLLTENNLFMQLCTARIFLDYLRTEISIESAVIRNQIKTFNSFKKRREKQCLCFYLLLFSVINSYSLYILLTCYY